MCGNREGGSKILSAGLYAGRHDLIEVLDQCSLAVPKEHADGTERQGAPTRLGRLARVQGESYRGKDGCGREEKYRKGD
jgi:hypothetical protein